MEKEYYIVVNDSRVGPLSFDQLRERCLEPSTLVWTAGMADWARADSLPELETLIVHSVSDNESAFGSYAQPEEPPHVKKPWEQNGNRQYGSNGKQFSQWSEEKGQFQVKTNWKTLAIVATVAGFLFSCIGGIVGIFAILEANKAENAQMSGFDQQAQNNWSNCKTLTIIAFVLVGLGLIGNVIVMRNYQAFMGLGL